MLFTKPVLELLNLPELGHHNMKLQLRDILGDWQLEDNFPNHLQACHTLLSCGLQTDTNMPVFWGFLPWFHVVGVVVTIFLTVKMSTILYRFMVHHFFTDTFGLAVDLKKAGPWAGM